MAWAKYIIDEGEDVALAAAEAGNLYLMDNPKLKGTTKVQRDFYFVLVIMTLEPIQHNSNLRVIQTATSLLALMNQSNSSVDA